MPNIRLCLNALQQCSLHVLLSASLGDELSMSQTGESWNRCVRPKAIGAWNLHELTKALPNLEQFVLFSSVVSWVGHQGARSVTCLSSLWRAPCHALGVCRCRWWGGTLKNTPSGSCMGHRMHSYSSVHACVHISRLHEVIACQGCNDISRLCVHCLQPRAES